MSWRHLMEWTVEDWHLDSRGRLWACDKFEKVMLVHGGEREAALGVEAPADPGILLPPGWRINRFCVTAADTIYAVAVRLTGGPGSVFRRGLAPGSPWEALPVPRALGILNSIAADAEDRIWVGGERGEVFRLEGTVWRKDMAPTPLHFKSFLVGRDGRLWATQHARLDKAVAILKEDRWRTRVTFRGCQDADLLFADDHGFIVRADEVIFRVADGDSSLGRPWLTPGTRVVAADSWETVWAIADGRLLRYEQGRWTDRGAAPFLPGAIICRDGQLLAQANSGLWVLQEAPAEGEGKPAWPLAPRQFLKSVSQGGIYGLAVLTLADHPHLFLARYTTTDVVVPLGAWEAVERWPSLTHSLGLDRLDESFHWTESYEMAVATADLNGDDAEDVVIATMYDGCRMLRNMHDRRLVPWTAEAGLGGFEDDIAEDVDLLDADADGDLDIHVCTLQGQNRLYLNNGSARFVEVSAVSGMKPPVGSASALCRDFDGDGDTDIAVATNGHGLFLHENLGPEGGRPRFRTTVSLAPLSHPQAPDGLSCEFLAGMEAADFDGDGLLDLFIANRTHPTRFCRNLGDLEFAEDPGVFATGAPDGQVAGVVCLDPDGDGDWDLACTGKDGTRFFENRNGLLYAVLQSDDVPAPAPGKSSTGSVLVDADGDGDLDYVEVYKDTWPILYENRGDPRLLTIAVQGPHDNASAVGAKVEVRNSRTLRLAAPVQEIPGGSGYASHGTKSIAVAGLHPDSSYVVAASLPCGRRIERLGVPGSGRLELSFRDGGIRGAATAVGHALRRTWNDRYGTMWAGAATLAILVLAAAGSLQRRRRGVGMPWPAVALALLVMGLAREIFPLDPGGFPIAVATLAGLATGLLAVGLGRVERAQVSTAELAEFGQSVKLFEHNRTPRKVVDRIALIRTNLPGPGREHEAIADLLREDIALFGTVVLAEFTHVVDGAQAVGQDIAAGRRSLRRLRSLHRTLAAAAGPALLQPPALTTLDDLLAETAAFKEWILSLLRRVDARIATPVEAFLERYRQTRRAIYALDIAVQTVAVSVRLPEPEFTRVLDCLLENAVRACPQGKAVLQVQGTLTAEGRLRLSVRDNGPGVAPDLRARIFEAGVRGLPGGSGYGLFAARRTVERYGGSLSLEDCGAGACFVIVVDTILSTGG